MEDIHLMLHKGDWIRNLTYSVYSAHPACLGQSYVMDVYTFQHLSEMMCIVPSLV